MVLDAFSKTPIKDILPDDMQGIAYELSKSPDQISCLRAAYDILTARFHGDRLKTFTHVLDLFSDNVSYLWDRRFLHCTNSNYLLRHLLIESGHFAEQDIMLCRTLIWHVSPHQYVSVKVGNKRIDVDIWASRYGIPFGDHSH